MSGSGIGAIAGITIAVLYFIGLALIQFSLRAISQTTLFFVPETTRRLRDLIMRHCECGEDEGVRGGVML